MKREVNIWDYAGHIMKSIGKGILLTTKADGQVNTMTIGWGQIGVIWSRPVFAVLVRESRHTKGLLDKNGEFTVNIPLAQADKQILAVCGTKSGRDMDKIKELGLTLADSETVSVPDIRELPLTVEGKVIYKQAPGTHNEGDHHTVYYGQITGAYILE